MIKIGILSTQFASGALLTAGSDYGDLGTSGLNEITNRINVESGILGGVSGALFSDEASLVAVSGAGFVVSGASVLNTTHRGSDGSNHSLLANKTSYLSIPATAWNVALWDKDGDVYARRLAARESNVVCAAHILLPQGAVITEVVFYGNAGVSDIAWTLHRIPLNTGVQSPMASANFNSLDNSITNPTIDNENFSYAVECLGLAINDEIWGGRITYTTDYI